ncbi:MAG TPA: peptidoglycan bridge formation glycyltransferase FemA/FemB family protein [Bryobacteraceae bacterium]|nr:peptidoglycan bridge formation glycyltransferase FemA/FemB family protein [Bryobacteraceae bacterium]
MDSCTPHQWAQWLDLFDDANLYQTWPYGSVRWGERRLSHLVLKRAGQVLGLAQVRIVQPTRLRFGIAYLRWGPLFERRGRPLDSQAAAIMAEALKEEYARKRKLLLRVVPNAFVGSPRAAAMEAAFHGFDRERPGDHNTYRTLVLDLSASLEELRKNLDKKWRNLLANSEKGGLRIVSGSGGGEFRRFCVLYGQMRKRKTFDTSVDIEEFTRIQEELPASQRMLVLICEGGGQPVAGVVASAIGNTAIYLLGATGDEGLKAKGSYLLQWNLIKWLKENGFRWYDLGGISPDRNPGVYHFKKGLSGADVLQVGPLLASGGAVSSAVATAAMAARSALRGCVRALRPARRLSLRAHEH